MKGTEHRLSDAEKHEWRNGRGNRRKGNHNFTKKICHWSYCVNCGLVALKNEATRKAQCEWEE